MAALAVGRPASEVRFLAHSPQHSFYQESSLMRAHVTFGHVECTAAPLPSLQSRRVDAG